MSAFMCSPLHIARLVVAGTRVQYQHASPCLARVTIDGKLQPIWLHRTNRPDLQLAVERLREGNARAMRDRYGAEAAAETAPLDDYLAMLSRLLENSITVDPVEALKLLDSYVYQTCEYRRYERHDSHRIVEALRHHLIRCLPGYEEADWSV